MSALATVVKGLRDFEAIVPIVAILRGVMSLMATSPSTMRWSGPPFCGPWNKGSAMNSPPRWRGMGSGLLRPIGGDDRLRLSGVTASLLTEPIMTQVPSGNAIGAIKPLRRQSEPL